MVDDKSRQELLDYTQHIRLWKRQWVDKSAELPSFRWERVRFDEANKVSVPDSPGLYAFFIEPELASFPNHAYLMYIGKAGDKVGIPFASVLCSIFKTKSALMPPDPRSTNF